MRRSLPSGPDHPVKHCIGRRSGCAQGTSDYSGSWTHGGAVGGNTKRAAGSCRTSKGANWSLHRASSRSAQRGADRLVMNSRTFPEIG